MGSGEQMISENRVSNRSIAKNLTIGMILTVLIVSTIAISINFYYTSQSAKAYIENKADELIESMSKILDISLWNFDEETVKGIGASYALNDLISKLKIVDSQGITYFEIDKKKDSSLITRSSKVLHGNKPVGRVDIALTSSYYKEISRQFILSGAFTILINLISLIITITFLLRHFLKKPLNYFTEIVSNYGSGNYDFQDKYAPANEFQPFIMVLNEMGDKISFQMTQLQKAGRELELRVENRTAELAKSNKELAFEISEHKQTEKSLRESEELYSAVVKQASEGIYLLDTDTKKLFKSNHAFQYLLGYTPEEISKLGIYHFLAYGKSAVDDAIHDIISNKYKFLGDSKYRHKNGTVLDFESHANLISFGGREVLCFVVRDITEKKALEDQLRQARKMESIGTLAGGIAHDFNNLLFMIVGNTELALEDMPKSNPAHANLEEIKSASRKAAGIVKQLLNFTRKTDQVLTPIDAVSVIEDALKFLRSTIPTTIEIRKRLPDMEISILADPIQISQIMMNLCANAFQTMEDTGGILEISVENVIIEEGAADSYPGLLSGNFFKLMVSDTGPGIAAEIIDRIFDPYFTTKDIGKGSGMGLAIVHGIVKNHDGFITVESEPGKGTTFSILLPVVIEKPVKEIEMIEKLPRGNETILFIDDEKAITNMIQEILERLGYQVETSLNPEEALVLFQSKSDTFDLVITDMTMPQMTGSQLAGKLMAIRADIPVIICTGHSSFIDEEKAKELGISGYLMKPVSMSKIAKAIRIALDKEYNANV